MTDKHTNSFEEKSILTISDLEISNNLPDGDVPRLKAGLWVTADRGY